MNASWTTREISLEQQDERIVRNNRFVHDGSGHMFNFDRDNNTSWSACADRVVFESNAFDWQYDTSDGFGDTLFNYSTTGRKCTRIESSRLEV